jgi:hypothetical protein
MPFFRGFISKVCRENKVSQGISKKLAPGGPPEAKMIEKLAIKNFKSIKELDIDCRRINLFIGEPNTGKSNILETLGIMSWHGNSAQKVKLNRFLRFEDIQNLFKGL